MRKGQPNKSKGQPRPHLWRSGPDPHTHQLYKRYHLSACQARHYAYDPQGRLVSPDQLWLISWPEFQALWAPVPHAQRHLMRACRRDRRRPWSRDNMEILTRSAMARRSKGRLRRAYVPEGVKRYFKELFQRQQQQRIRARQKKVDLKQAKV